MIKTRDIARLAISEKGITVENITVEQKKSLHKEISKCMKSSDVLDGTMRINKMRKGGHMTCASFYFANREVVTFNRDGFIGIAGWADDTNVRPILDGIENWLSYTTADQND